MLTALGDRAKRWTETGAPWTNVYGVARSLMALASALTLAFNQSSTLWRPIAGVVSRAPFCTTNVLQKGALYCLLPTHLDLSRWIAVALLLVVASGYRPQLTGIVHWWVAASYQLTASTLEGGDQAAAVLTLLLIPVTLTDPRRWHWQSLPTTDQPPTLARSLRTLVALSALVATRVQVCGIYFHAAFGKMQGTEWADGTAMYYWLQHPTFGATSFWAPVLRPLLSSAPLLAGTTWGTIIVELFLFMGLIATRPARKALLLLGLLLHVGVLVFMGLFTFSLMMFAALLLYLWPTDEPLRIPRALHLGRLFHRSRVRSLRPWRRQPSEGREIEEPA